MDIKFNNGSTIRVDENLKDRLQSLSIHPIRFYEEVSLHEFEDEESRRNRMKILVTGGKGFIGSHVVELLRKNNEVTVMDMDTAGFYCPNVEYITYDMSGNPRELAAFLDYIQPEVIIHLAAWSSIGASQNHPAELYKMNIMPTANLIQAMQPFPTDKIDTEELGSIAFCKGTSVKHIVFASSSAVIGGLSSHYGASKYACEGMWQAFQANTGIPVALLRFGNVYGPGQNPQNGTLVPNAIQQLRHGEGIEIFGCGDQTRDYIYVADLAVSIKAVMRTRLSGVHNVSTGESRTTLEMADYIRWWYTTVTGKEGRPHRYTGVRTGDKGHVEMPQSEMLNRAFLNYGSPTDFMEALGITVEWYMNMPEIEWNYPMCMNGNGTVPLPERVQKISTLAEWLELKER